MVARFAPHTFFRLSLRFFFNYNRCTLAHAICPSIRSAAENIVQDELHPYFCFSAASPELECFSSADEVKNVQFDVNFTRNSAESNLSILVIGRV